MTYNNNLVEDVDYKLFHFDTENEDDPKDFGLIFLSGEFKDVIIRIHELSVLEEDDDGFQLAVDFKVINPNNKEAYKIEKSEQLEKALQHIFGELLTKSINLATQIAEEKEKNEDRK